MLKCVCVDSSKAFSMYYIFVNEANILISIFDVIAMKVNPRNVELVTVDVSRSNLDGSCSKSFEKLLHPSGTPPFGGTVGKVMSKPRYVPTYLCIKFIRDSTTNVPNYLTN